MEHEYILEVLNVTKRFPGVVANNNVTIQVKPGEILGLIGENGAGKSTILGVMNGVYPHGTFEGTIKIDGVEVKNSSTLDAQKAGIGFVPQEINVLKYLTVTENIFLPKFVRDNKFYVNVEKYSDKAQAILDDYGINLKPSDKAGILSIGEQQLLMIARALVEKPKILILDEPTTSLTTEEVDILFKLMRRLKDMGVSMLFVSHRLEEILEITDRVTVLRDGCNAGLFGREEYSRERIIEAMVGRSISNLYPTRESKIGDEILRVEGLTVEHPQIENRYLLKDVSFNLRRGEVLGFAGLIGAGRSETLKAIYGALKKKSGDVYLKGKKIDIRSEKDAINAGLSFVTENRKVDGLFWIRDLMENITINNLKAISNKSIISPKEEKERAQKYADMFAVKMTGLSALAHSLSGGNQQKIVIARAMNAEPEILLLDEPTKGIDVGAKNDIYNIINQLVANGVSIVMVSSDLPELLAMCDRFVVMAGGEIKGILPKEEADDKKIMMLAAQ